MKIAGEILETKATEQLRAEKKLPARYQPGDLSGAIRSAARCAADFGKDAYVILGNSYGAGCWFIKMDRRDVTSYIVNSGRKAYRITATREIYRINIEA